MRETKTPKHLPNLFSELRLLEEEDFSVDPKKWKKEKQ